MGHLFSAWLSAPSLWHWRLRWHFYGRHNFSRAVDWSWKPGVHPQIHFPRVWASLIQAARWPHSLSFYLFFMLDCSRYFLPAVSHLLTRWDLTFFMNQRKCSSASRETKGSCCVRGRENARWRGHSHSVIGSALKGHHLPTGFFFTPAGMSLSFYRGVVRGTVPIWRPKHSCNVPDVAASSFRYNCMFLRHMHFSVTMKYSV